MRLNRAFKEGPFSAQSAKTHGFATAQNGNYPPKATVSKPLWARKFRHAHDVGKNRVAKALCFSGEYIFINFDKTIKQKTCQEAAKTKTTDYI